MTSNPLITAPAHFSPRHVAHLHRRIVFWLRGALEARMGNAPVEVNRVSALIMDAMMLVWSDVLRLAVDVEDVGAMPCDQCIAFDVFPERALPPAPGTTRRRRRGSGDDNAIAVQYYGETTGGEGVSSKSKSNSKVLGIGVTGELPGCSQGTLVSIVHRTCVAVVLLVKEQALADDLHARITLPDGFKQPQTWSEALALSNNSFQTVFGCDHGNTSSPGMRVEEAPTAQQTMDSTSAVVVADDMLPLLCQTIVDPHVQKQSGIAVGPCHSELLEALLDGGVSGESLAAFLRRTTLQATTTCSTLNRNFTSSHANCSVDALHHIVRFASGSVMVSVNVEHVSPDEGTDPEVIMTWTACTSCKCRTEAQALTSIAAQYPLYNFLALLIHDPSFVPTSIPFCKLHEEKFVDPEASTASGIAKILGIRGSDTSQLIAHLNATGINAGHRFDIVRCFQIGDKMVSFHVEQVHPMSIGELPHELNVDMNRRMADHGAQLQAQTLVIQRYWARLIAHMDALSKHIAQHASGQSKTFKSFRATIEQEHVRFNEMINLAALEVERLSKSGRRQSGAQVSYDFGSPTLLLRTLRKSVFDKMVAVDRELLHWTTTNLSSTLIRSPQYDITPHPDSARLNSFSHLEPTTMLAFALSAQEVRDLMSAMEEIHEHALAHVDFAADSFDPLLIQRLMTEGGYPLIFESKHGDFVSSATLIDGQHIRFRYADARMSTRPTSVGSVGSGQSGTSSTSDATTELVVTIYHALEFSSLRKAFDLSNTAFIQSMSGCREWKPSGGKSASRFFRTNDDRLIVKQMGLRHRRWYDRGTALRSGGMASMMSLSGPPTLKSSTSSIKESEVVANDQERIMVLNLAPKLLRYLLARTDTRAASESLPTLLVKMFGMFHVRFSQRNTDMSTLTDDTSSFVSGRSSGNPGVDMEMTLVVSENLYFGGASFSERYDLKGIRARCIAAANSPTAALDEVLERLALSTGSRPPSPTLPGTNVVDDRQSSPTLLDREWLENNRDNSATMFLSPEAKFHLHQALINDTDFLTSANIVDYSLLIGVDRDKRRLRLGIVDYTQQFDMWKAAESAGKTLGKMLEHRVTMVKSVVVDNAHRSSLALDTGDVAAGRRSMRQRLFKLVSHYGSSSVVQPTTGTSSMPNSRHAPTATPRKELPPRPTSMFVQTPMVNKALADATAEPAAAAVTILPPDRYRTRFLRTLNDYMPMVPGRWTDVSRYEC